MRTVELTLTPDESRSLRILARRRRIPADTARRARLVLMLAAKKSYEEIQRALDCSPATVSLWRRRFMAERLAGLESRHEGRTRSVLTPALEAKILERTRQAPPDGSTHWTTRKLAAVLKVSHMTIARAWRRAGLRPHRFGRYMASDDPDFETKAANIIGLYACPPQHAAVFCMDEKTAIQALDRLDPVLPLSPGRFERHGFEYRRHGTLSLLAAFDTRSGEVIGRTVPRHTAEAFVGFLSEIIATQPPGKQIHVILDNLSVHKSKRVAAFLEQNPDMHLHFTPTYSSWLNQVELWFAKIERDVINRGVFTSVADLSRKIMRYIRLYNRRAKPIRWTYTDTSKRIRPTIDSSVTGN